MPKPDVDAELRQRPMRIDRKVFAKAGKKPGAGLDEHDVVAHDE